MATVETCLIFDSKNISKGKIRTLTDIIKKILENWDVCAPRNNSKHLQRFSPSLLKIESIECDLHKL